MPGLVKKLLIFAAVDGLILQPLPQRGQRQQPAVKIAFDDGSIRAVQNLDHSPRGSDAFEAFGVAGLVTVSKFSFLISIIRRQQVAQIHGKPIYVITEVALTPLTSKGEADISIARTHLGLQKAMVDGHESAQDGSDSDSGEDQSTAGSDDVEDENLTSPPRAPKKHAESTSVAENVISKKGSYGRFAQKWFSKGGWTAGQKRKLGMSTLESGLKEQQPAKESLETLKTEGKGVSQATGASSLLPKLLRTTQVLFGTSRSFYFSYDYDITRSLVNQSHAGSEPLSFSKIDPLFFWNKHILSPFIDSGHTSLALPLMQGFVGQKFFSMTTKPTPSGLSKDDETSMEMADFRSDKSRIVQTERSDELIARSGDAAEKSFLLTLISRRSVRRAGLRYLRRGVDEDGYTANEVETEQILTPVGVQASEAKTQSFVQLRGSIPIFFTQSPYSFKPVPQIQHSEETNMRAFRRHFQNVAARYGSVQITSLVEKHGVEAIVGEQYEKYVTCLNEASIDRLGFEWFDFHAVCRGMHFENVSYLLDALEGKLDEFGHTILKNGVMISKQKGVLRTNCMDCLDRSNVVQSACARRALEVQLREEGIDMSLQEEQSTTWFNLLWADNGDAISKQYASTAALKGDFTRTRKRNYAGALTDMGLSISRFYNGIVNDYFSQAAIDFLLGNVTSLVFEDFEANMMSGDLAISMPKMRQQAIALCEKLVVADEHEELIGGWTLLTPQTPNTIKSSSLEEIVLLLTDAAICTCQFDWNTEKVHSFTRVALHSIRHLLYGTYITNTLSPAQCDASRNIGFVLRYDGGGEDTIHRVNTRSLTTELLEVETGKEAEADPKKKGKNTAANDGAKEVVVEKRLMAFKALSSRSATATSESEAAMTSKPSEKEIIRTICTEVKRAVDANVGTLSVRENIPSGEGQASREGTIGDGRNGSEERAGPREEVYNDTGNEINDLIVEEGDIITLDEARRSTGIVEQISYGLKKLVWA